MHTENPIVHECRPMLQYCNIVSFLNCWLFLPNCDALGKYDELEKVKRLLKDKPGTNKVNLGKWVWSKSNQWPSWDAISKAPIWSAEWESFRLIMAKPIIRPALVSSAEDKERTLTLGEGDKQQVSVASVVHGKPVAQKLGATAWYVRHTNGPCSIFLLNHIVCFPPFTLYSSGRGGRCE